MISNYHFLKQFFLERSFSNQGAMAWNHLSKTRGIEDLTSIKLAISRDITFYSYSYFV